MNPQQARRQSQPSPVRNPAFVKAEGEAMLALAQTLRAVCESPAYQAAANPSWWKRIFG